ncbi:hypothetical protein B566_EDAN017692 [Ephemera danica]|nr:hypothetical protein B566_EDAN017692 [Ephemera danica]
MKTLVLLIVLTSVLADGRRITYPVKKLMESSQVEVLCPYNVTVTNVPDRIPKIIRETKCVTSRKQSNISLKYECVQVYSKMRVKFGSSPPTYIPVNSALLYGGSMDLAQCRTCSGEAQAQGSLLLPRHLMLRRWLYRQFEIEVSEDNGLPDRVCYNCLAQIRGWIYFSTSCRKTQQTLHDQLAYLASHPVHENEPASSGCRTLAVRLENVNGEPVDSQSIPVKTEPESPQLSARCRSLALRVDDVDKREEFRRTMVYKEPAVKVGDGSPGSVRCKPLSQRLQNVETRTVHVTDKMIVTRQAANRKSPSKTESKSRRSSLKKLSNKESETPNKQPSDETPSKSQKLTPKKQPPTEQTLSKSEKLTPNKQPSDETPSKSQKLTPKKQPPTEQTPSKSQKLTPKKQPPTEQTLSKSQNLTPNKQPPEETPSKSEKLTPNKPGPSTTPNLRKRSQKSPVPMSPDSQLRVQPKRDSKKLVQDITGSYYDVMLQQLSDSDSSQDEPLSKRIKKMEPENVDVATNAENPAEGVVDFPAIPSNVQAVDVVQSNVPDSSVDIQEVSLKSSNVVTSTIQTPGNSLESLGDSIEVLQEIQKETVMVQSTPAKESTELPDTNTRKSRRNVKVPDYAQKKPGRPRKVAEKAEKVASKRGRKPKKQLDVVKQRSMSQTTVTQTASVPQTPVDVPKSTVSMPQNTVDVPQNTVSMDQNTVAVPLTASQGVPLSEHMASDVQPPNASAKQSSPMKTKAELKFDPAVYKSQPGIQPTVNLSDVMSMPSVQRASVPAPTRDVHPIVTIPPTFTVSTPNPAPQLTMARPPENVSFIPNNPQIVPNIIVPTPKQTPVIVSPPIQSFTYVKTQFVNHQPTTSFIAQSGSVVKPEPAPTPIQNDPMYYKKAWKNYEVTKSDCYSVDNNYQQQQSSYNQTQYNQYYPNVQYQYPSSYTYPSYNVIPTPSPSTPAYYTNSYPPQYVQYQPQQVYYQNSAQQQDYTQAQSSEAALNYSNNVQH